MKIVAGLQTKEIYRNTNKLRAEEVLAAQQANYRLRDQSIETVCPLTKGLCTAACINFVPGKIMIGEQRENTFRYNSPVLYWYVYEILNHCTNSVITGYTTGNITVYK